jgi:hypothetical protein
MNSSQSQPWSPVPLIDECTPSKDAVNQGSQREIIVTSVATATILSTVLSRFRSKFAGGRLERWVKPPEVPGWYWPGGNGGWPPAGG